MGELVACPACGHLHPEAADGKCPACGAAASAAPIGGIALADETTAPLARDVASAVPLAAADPEPEAPLALDPSASGPAAEVRRRGMRRPGADALAGPDEETLVADAAAQITWGKEAKDVRAHLVRRGMDAARAERVVAGFVAERNQKYRARGIADLGIGAALVVVGLYGVFALFAQLKAVAGFVLAYGGYRIVRGVMRVLMGGQGEGADSVGG